MDVYLTFGGSPVPAQTVPGTSVALSDSVGAAFTWGYGYQVWHSAAGSLWVDISSAFEAPHQRTSILPGNVEMDTTYTAPGVRFMVPVQAKISLYAVAGGGAGFYSVPRVTGDMVFLRSPIHGVFDFGGGLDVRLNRSFSLRVELRDYISGHNLSGVAGPNHLLPTAGLAYHF